MRAFQGFRRLRITALAGGLLLGLALRAGALELPPEGRCPDFTGAAGAENVPDTGTPLLEEGGVLGLGDLLALQQLLPPEVWTYREAFFYEGMRMEIGHCHRRYPTSEFYAAATERFSSRAELREDGDLAGYVAGLPFPPQTIAADDPRAGLRWAWDFAHRYRGAGPVGSFRILDLPSRVGQPQTYMGDFFWVRTAHRADLAVSDYREPESKKTLWVAGGTFDEPFDARHLAWRQIRPREVDEDWSEPDDTFVYVPELRKPRRAASSWIDGLFTPRYTVAGNSNTGALPYAAGGSAEYPSFETVTPGAGLATQVTEDIRRGFTGLVLRPNAYEWTVVGEREVLAPLNARVEGYPVSPERNYGPSGLSVATDTWDVRYAVVLQGLARKRIDGVAAVVVWLDAQTLQPLYWITKRENGLPLDVGILVHRFSGDRAEYPAWPGGEAANVFDPVASVFYYVPGGGAGWRRESYDVRSLPLEPGRLRKLTSTDELMKGH